MSANCRPPWPPRRPGRRRAETCTCAPSPRSKTSASAPPRDIEQAHKYALERFANDLVGVKDSLELGLASEGTLEALRAGTEATLKLLASAFEKAGVTEVSPLGEPFNPEFHEAMMTQPSAEHPPNAVLQVVQKGYQLNGRLLRPARVIVAREP